MNKLTAQLFIAIFSCYVNAQQLQPIVLHEGDTSTIDGEFITEVKLRDNFRIKCSYKMGVDFLREKANENGANLIKITTHKPPDVWSTCHRFAADLYKVPDVRVYEKSISWSPHRQLQWVDFKAISSPSKYYTSQVKSACEFNVYTNAFNTYRNSRFFIYTTFSTYDSWVNADDTTSTLLNHERRRFDLCEVYARLLYKELIDNKITGYDFEEAEMLVSQIKEEYLNRILKYDLQTDYGKNEDEQRKWDWVIQRELSELDAYKDHY